MFEGKTGRRYRILAFARLIRMAPSVRLCVAGRSSSVPLRLRMLKKTRAFYFLGQVRNLVDARTLRDHDVFPADLLASDTFRRPAKDVIQAAHEVSIASGVSPTLGVFLSVIATHGECTYCPEMMVFIVLQLKL